MSSGIGSHDIASIANLEGLGTCTAGKIDRREIAALASQKSVVLAVAIGKPIHDLAPELMPRACVPTMVLMLPGISKEIRAPFRLRKKPCVLPSLALYCPTILPWQLIPNARVEAASG